MFYDRLHHLLSNISTKSGYRLDYNIFMQTVNKKISLYGFIYEL